MRVVNLMTSKRYHILHSKTTAVLNQESLVEKQSIEYEDLSVFFCAYTYRDAIKRTVKRDDDSFAANIHLLTRHIVNNHSNAHACLL